MIEIANVNGTRIMETGVKEVSDGWGLTDTINWAYCHMPYDGDPEECAEAVAEYMGWLDGDLYPWSFRVDSSYYSDKLLVRVFLGPEPILLTGLQTSRSKEG